MSDKWEKIRKEISKEGTTITYSLPNTEITIESRKRHISHANGSGTWDYTSYFILKNGQELAEKRSLKDAKEYVEREVTTCR